MEQNREAQNCVRTALEEEEEEEEPSWSRSFAIGTRHQVVFAEMIFSTRLAHRRRCGVTFISITGV